MALKSVILQQNMAVFKSVFFCLEYYKNYGTTSFDGSHPQVTYI